jgi:hypothetical protein
MRWGMALNMMDLCSHVEQNIPKIEFPFLVLHDPEDQIVLFQGDTPSN